VPTAYDPKPAKPCMIHGHGDRDRVLTGGYAGRRGACVADTWESPRSAADLLARRQTRACEAAGHREGSTVLRWSAMASTKRGAVRGSSRRGEGFGHRWRAIEADVVCSAMICEVRRNALDRPSTRRIIGRTCRYHRAWTHGGIGLAAFRHVKSCSPSSFTSRRNWRSSKFGTAFPPGQAAG